MLATQNGPPEQTLLILLEKKLCRVKP